MKRRLIQFLRAAAPVGVAAGASAAGKPAQCMPNGYHHRVGSSDEDAPPNPPKGKGKGRGKYAGKPTFNQVPPPASLSAGRIEQRTPSVLEAIRTAGWQFLQEGVTAEVPTGTEAVPLGTVTARQINVPQSDVHSGFLEPVLVHTPAQAQQMLDSARMQGYMLFLKSI